MILIDESAINYCDTDTSKPHAEITNALPEAWYARIQFDELLDPSIEDLVANVDDNGMPDGTYSGTLANTQPVTLQCQSVTNNQLVDIPYDGYYSPSGNSITYPLGPSLVIVPKDPTLVATGQECQVTLKDNIKDKDGNQVPTDQRGPYKWKIGQVEVVAISPSDGDKLDPIAAGVDITFNTAIDATALDPTLAPPAWTFTPAVDNPYVQQETGEEFFFGGDFPAAGGPFTFAFASGAMLTDQCGKATTLAAPTTADFTKVSFSTNALSLASITGAAEPGAMINLNFNQYMDDTTVASGTDFTITPTPANLSVEPNLSTGAVRIYGDFALATQYTFVLKGGASIDDCPGGEFTSLGGNCVKSATYTNSADQTLTFTTASAITLKSATPADNFKDTVSDFGIIQHGIVLTFNDNIDPASFDAADYTLTGPATALTITNRGTSALTNYEQIRINATTAWLPGDYVFTLKASAVLTDRLGNNYSPPADKVIHFHIDADDTTPTPPCF
ncbi:MAG: Ig-like domain-containing protein [Kofleriaceae bacterium]